MPAITADDAREGEFSGILARANAWMMTRALHKLRAEGVRVQPDAVAALSPYVRSHISRFGQYTLDPGRTPAAIDYELPIFTDGTTSTATSAT